ncbi:response regulator [Capillimicrobium parvum]|uniref:response regulator n=1 Tax=Capillimicrobium parvum TaxID=2884022 RepID=UPI00216B1B27|nr:response regulator transcription factor [Capillimicrobium parvum]
MLADPDPISRQVIRRALIATHDFMVGAETGDGAKAVEMVCVQRPDFAVIEARMPGQDAAVAIRQIAEHAPGTIVVVFTAVTDDDVLLDLLRAGAAAVVSKAQGVDSMIRALHVVARGEVVIPRTLTASLIERMRTVQTAARGLRPVDSPLTDREWEIVDLFRAGASPSEVADDLFLTRETVYRHLKNVMRKLGVHRRADVVAIADRVVRTSLVAA